MATVNKDPMQEKVTVFVPKIPGDDPMLYVGLNGKGWNIPRGMNVEVPKPVADIIAQSQKNAGIVDAFSRDKQRLMHEKQGV